MPRAASTYLGSVQVERALERSVHGVRQLVGLSRAARRRSTARGRRLGLEVGGEDQKLVGDIARDDVHGAGGLAQPARGLAQELVGAVAPEALVDQAEAIEVDVENGDLSLARAARSTAASVSVVNSRQFGNSVNSSCPLRYSIRSRERSRSETSRTSAMNLRPARPSSTPTRTSAGNVRPSWHAR